MKETTLSPDAFNESMKMFPITSMEVVPIYVENGKISVLLTQRSSDDKFWPSMWHCPGTMVRNSDVDDKGTLNIAWKRLKEKEFMNIDLPDPIWVSTKVMKGDRGNVTECIHFVLIPGNLKIGKYVDVDNLPPDLIKVHYQIIREAVNSFKGEIITGRLTNV